MKLYTKAGDGGRASTANRRSIPKDSPVFELLGTLDEFTSAMGVAKQSAPDKHVFDLIETLQQDIVKLSGELAGYEKFATPDRIRELESAIDSLMETVPEFSGFVLPGKSACGAALDVARTVARRAERRAVAMAATGGVPRDVLIWLNRVSDLMYALDRLCDGMENGGKPAPAPQSSPAARAAEEAPLHYGTVGELTCRRATAICEAVLQRAREQGLRLIAAVCDTGGNLVSLQRDDDAIFASIDIAVNKAFTSASLKMTTEEVGRLAQPGAPLYGIQQTNGGRIVIFGGGVPLLKDGRVVGALGVSGGTLEQDTAMGNFGAEVAQYILNKEV